MVAELSADSPLAFLAANPNFTRLRGMVQDQPEMLPSMLQQIAGANPELVEVGHAQYRAYALDSCSGALCLAETTPYHP